MVPLGYENKMNDLWNHVSCNTTTSPFDGVLVQPFFSPSISEGQVFMPCGVQVPFGSFRTNNYEGYNTKTFIL